MAASTKKRWFRFSLASLFIVFTALSLWFARESYLARRQKAAIDAIVATEGTVRFDDDSRSSDAKETNADPPVTERIRQSIGEDFFRTVKSVDFATNNGRRRGTQQPKVTKENLALLAGLSDIEILELGHNDTVNDDALVHLRGLQNLKTLYLYHTPVRGPGLIHLVGLPRLESLSLSRAHLTDEGLEHIGRMSRLRWLRLDHTIISDKGTAHLAGLMGLEDLSLAYTDISDACLAYLEPLTRLKTLGLQQTEITAEGAQRIRRALPNCNVSLTFGLGQEPTEVELFPDDQPHAVDDFKARFKELGIDGHVWADSSQPGNPITQMYLGQITFSDKAALRIVAAMPALKQLTIRGALVGDDFVRGLASLKQLEYLELSESRVTDEGLHSLSHLTNLRELVLNNNRITDKGVPDLAKLRSLKYLHLNDTRISDDGIKQLMQALPRSQIY